MKLFRKRLPLVLLFQWGCIGAFFGFVIILILLKSKFGSQMIDYSLKPIQWMLMKLGVSWGTETYYSLLIAQYCLGGFVGGVGFRLWGLHQQGW